MPQLGATLGFSSLFSAKVGRGIRPTYAWVRWYDAYTNEGGADTLSFHIIDTLEML